jgi:DNA modification methylase
MKIRDRISELRRVPASELRPNPKNWRTHPKAQADALKGVLAEVGIADAVLARELEDGTLMLLDGHLRVETMGDQILPVLVLDVNEAEGDKVLATLDPLAAMAESDAAKLDAILREVDTGSPELQQMLSGLAEDAGLYQDGDKEIVEDEVPEPPVDPITKPGDLWVLGGHRLLCGDSTKAEDAERLMAGDRINVAFTSPPYASQRKYDESSGFKPIPESDFCDWFDNVQQNVKSNITDDGSWFVNIKAHCDDGCRSLYVFDLVLSHVRKWGWRLIDDFVWRRNGLPGSWDNRFKNQHEPVFHFSLGRSIKFNPDSVRNDSEDSFSYKGKLKSANTTNPISFSGSDVDRQAGTSLPGNVLPPFRSEAVQHEAAFPVGLPSFFIKAYSDKGDNVYEPFCGSGTTLIAAEQLGRKCYGMEISPQYCDVIVKRWETLTGKKAELETPTKKPKAK